MSGISPLTLMSWVWAVVTAAFVILMIYRSLVAMKEDDQLFLNPVESSQEAEQKEIRGKITRLAPYAKGFGFTSAGLGVLIAGFWLYEGITRLNTP